MVSMFFKSNSTAAILVHYDISAETNEVMLFNHELQKHQPRTPQQVRQCWYVFKDETSTFIHDGFGVNPNVVFKTWGQQMENGRNAQLPLRFLLVKIGGGIGVYTFSKVLTLQLILRLWELFLMMSVSIEKKVVADTRINFSQQRRLRRRLSLIRIS